MSTYQNLENALSALPKVHLGFYPTPLQKLENLSSKYGVNIYLKRDDFSGISLFGGNKIRKLEYLMGDAIHQGCDTVFTYGATQSNHAMQTATVARRCGLLPILYLAAIVEPDQESIRANLLLDTILGAEVHIVPAEDGSLANASARAAVLAKQQMEQLEKNGHKCYDVPLGGASVIGTCGFIEGFMELQKQLEAIGEHADYLFTATGTGGTLAGITAGKKALSSDVQIVGITVGDKPTDYPQHVADLSNTALKLLNYQTIVTTNDFFVDRNYFAPGYEQPNEMANSAIRELARTEGVFTDPVYSGKGFSGMLDYIKSGKISQGSTVVYLHTGGTTALFAENEIIGSLSKA